ncbi:unnamed protein product [Durusdinium trenchii]|uniref:Saccharopine dehydrogenase NADP binding domain-containing protein n=1 Tax=Durusdinium trenchii TaxID=1381693 RepID=A0ABP0Q1M6_9DINO
MARSPRRAERRNRERKTKPVGRSEARPDICGRDWAPDRSQRLHVVKRWAKDYVAEFRLVKMPEATKTLHNGTVYMFQEREKGRLQKLVKDFAKEVVSGIPVNLVNPATAHPSPHFFQMDRHLTVFSLKPKDGSTAEAAVQDYSVKELTKIYKGPEVLMNAPNLGVLAQHCVAFDTTRVQALWASSIALVYDLLTLSCQVKLLHDQKLSASEALGDPNISIARAMDAVGPPLRSLPQSTALLGQRRQWHSNAHSGRCTALDPRICLVAVAGCAAVCRAPQHSARRAVSALVVGGTGRVGGSTARWLQRLAEETKLELEVAVGGRNKETWHRRPSGASWRWTTGTLGRTRSGGGVVVDMLLSGEQLRRSEAVSVICAELRDRKSVKEAMALQQWDVVVHTAGPFQGVTEPNILKEALELGVPYVDVCDDTELCKTAKSLAKSSVPAIVSAGIWPGVSALMVREAYERLGSIEDLEMSFYTAGTGGAGPTIVSATFLLLAEPPLNYQAGQEVRAEPWGQRRLVVDFGPGVGQQPVHLLDEPEVYTCHEYLGIPNISSSFGTAPDIWNWMFAAARVLPRSVLANRGLMQQVSTFSMPIITAVDQFVGSINAMHIKATGPADASGRRSVATLRVAHQDLEDCVGLATAAFAFELLEKRVKPGVWFPVEMDAASRSSIFRRVQHGSILWDL